MDQSYFNQYFQDFLSLDLSDQIAIIVGLITIIIGLLGLIISIKQNSKKNKTQEAQPKSEQRHHGEDDNVRGNKTVNHYYSGKPIEQKSQDTNQSEAEITESIEKPEKDYPPIKELPHTANTKLFGRRNEQALLTRAWNNETNIVVLVAMGGTGKTALLKKWKDRFNDANDYGAKKIFTWSFYSQGAAEDKQADATPFFDAALEWFGYSGDPITSDHDKGIKLAELVNQQKSLLILDGLEPLQQPVGVMRGVLKDKDLQVLLTQLAAHNQGLCVISSRQVVVEIKDKPLVITHPLEQLQTADGIALLKAKSIHGSEQDLATAVKEVKGHALALNLLGSYLSTVYDGDIRQRDKIPALSDDLEEGKHAEKVMAAYEQHLENQPELVILYLLAIFDRPVSDNEFGVLFKENPVKKGFFESLKYVRKNAAQIKQIAPTFAERSKYMERFGSHEARLSFVSPVTKLSASQLQYTLKNLRKQNLLNKNLNSKASTLDTHPLIREYFAKRFKSQYPDAWQQAHHALYEYYKNIEDKEEPKNTDEMNHLFTAVVHGCAAGLHQKALDDVYWNRILRQNEHYITHKLGAFSTDLAILSHFFDKPWQTPAEGLTDEDKAATLNWAAFGLRALGRLEEAVEPFKAGLDMRIEEEKWKSAAANASNLSELQLTRGNIPKAKATAQQSVELADRSGDMFEQISDRAILADTYHQAGDWTEAQDYFEKAKALQQEWQPELSQLYSLQGFRYCDLLLTAGQWQEVQQRASQTLEWAKQQLGLLSNALDRLSLGRASLQAVYLEYLKALFDSTVDTTQWQTLTMPPEAMVITQNDLPQAFTANQQINESQQTAINWLNQAVEGLRKAGAEEFIPLGLLARASYARFAILLDVSATEKALQDLQETHEIAQRSGMKLHLTDYHLEATRLALTINQDIHNQTAQQYLNQAKTLIQQTGYHRRDGEVTYLEGLLKQ